MPLTNHPDTRQVEAAAAAVRLRMRHNVSQLTQSVHPTVLTGVFADRIAEHAALISDDLTKRARALKESSVAIVAGLTGVALSFELGRWSVGRRSQATTSATNGATQFGATNRATNPSAPQRSSTRAPVEILPLLKTAGIAVSGLAVGALASALVPKTAAEAKLVSVTQQWNAATTKDILSTTAYSLLTRTLKRAPLTRYISTLAVVMSLAASVLAASEETSPDATRPAG